MSVLAPFAALRGLNPLVLAIAVTACAVPATEVSVPTMPMRDALELSRGMGKGIVDIGPPPNIHAIPPPPTGVPQAIVSAPDIRLVYIFEWVDSDGNKHFGEWVAIPVTGFDWIMGDKNRTASQPIGDAPAPTQQ